MDKPAVDHLLEMLWGLQEEGEVSLSRCADHISRDELAELERRELICRRDGETAFTREGERQARDVVRRHRLAEMLFHQVFEVSDPQADSTACEFEHLLSPEVAASVCAFLGHPAACPHGRPIPQGECCSRLTGTVRPLVVPLAELDSGQRGRIVFISSKRPWRLERLSTMGILPGSVVSLHQKRPTFVVQAGETEIALDPEIVAEIYVRPLSWEAVPRPAAVRRWRWGARQHRRL